MLKEKLQNEDKANEFEKWTGYVQWCVTIVPFAVASSLHQPAAPRLGIAAETDGLRDLHTVSSNHGDGERRSTETGNVSVVLGNHLEAAVETGETTIVRGGLVICEGRAVDELLAKLLFILVDFTGDAFTSNHLI